MFGEHYEWDRPPGAKALKHREGRPYGDHADEQGDGGKRYGFFDDGANHDPTPTQQNIE
jgi:hypothetical protein